MKPVIVPLYSNTCKYKGDIEIYPFSICGYQDLSHNGKVLESKGCQIDDHHAVAGGRHQQIFDVPKGFKKMRLTLGETHSVYEALGADAAKFLLPDTVHGAWKIRCNQGAVLVKDYD